MFDFMVIKFFDTGFCSLGYHLFCHACCVLNNEKQRKERTNVRRKEA